MPYPLKPGYNFNFHRTVRPPHYEMNTSEAYTDFYGISYMVSGERLIYSPDFTTIVQAGELTFIPKNLYRRTTYISNNPYERILIKFTDKMIEGVISTIGRKAFDELCTEHVIRFSDDTRAKIVSILEDMEQEWNSYNQYSELLLTGLLNKLIITCLTERLTNETSMINYEKKNSYLGDAIKYIKAHLRDNPSLDDTAKAINISASYLSKIFINHLNTPYSAFILNERLTYARKLLLNSDMSMTDIATESGFSSNAYFSDCFKKSTGMSPLQFRKSNN
ncbi:MAG: helix-turn-helix transcriptional regulator [Lachnospira sp.]|nr:helix-turn-helix transcriptional regulator [Lachnospira sp.]